MIAQLLDRDFLKSKGGEMVEDLRREAAALERGDAGAVERAQSTGASAADLRAAADELERELDRLAAGTVETGADGRDDTDNPFLGREDRLSLLQSALEEFYHDKAKVVQSRTARGATADEVAITDEELDPAAAAGRRGRELFEPFSHTDPGWAAVLYAKAVRNVKGRRPFNPNPASPARFGNRARVLMVSDWGTGVPRARKVSAVMRGEIDVALAASVECHVIHLGDVYYSGWPREYDKHFLPYWPVRLGEESRITSWCLNANHDMYSGGDGYYDHLLKDPRFSPQAQSSFFSIENDHWQILGLDSAYDDEDLAGGQVTWARRTREAARQKRGMLLTHHQPFSAYEKDTVAVRDKLQPLVNDGLVRAWFWGHEHRCAIYAPRNGLQYGRCIGHGGVPVYASSKPLPAGVLHEYQGAIRSGFEKFAKFGFAALDFDKEKIDVRYINEDAEVHYSETLT